MISAAYSGAVKVQSKAGHDSWEQVVHEGCCDTDGQLRIRVRRTLCLMKHTVSLRPHVFELLP